MSSADYPAGSRARSPRTALSGRATGVRSRRRRGSRRHGQPFSLPIAPSGKRITTFFMISVFAITIASGRAILLQGIDASANAQAAAEQLTRTQVLKAERGLILDRNGQRLAETQPAFMVIADPYAISTNGKDATSMSEEEKEEAERAPEEIAKILVRYLGGSTSDYLPKLTAKRNDDGSPNMYEVLKRKVAADLYQKMSDELKAGGWYGIYAQDDPVRYYPNGQLAASVIGYVNFEGDGAGGLEYWENEQLKGTDGTQSYQVSPYGQIPLGDTTFVEPVNGSTFQTTIDAELQWMAETELAHVVETYDATSATAVVMAVNTGEILALANVPSFDPNDIANADEANLGNRAVTDAYEPGSVQKVLTMAALVDQGLVTADTAVEVPGSIDSGGAKINDAWDHGTLYLTARGVLAQSSNVGTVLMARQSDKQVFSDYLRSFGLGQATGIQLPGESLEGMGWVPDGTMADYTLDQISFGQGLSVTAVQEAAAIAAVTNGGIYHQPTILASATTSSGESIPIEQAEPRRVVQESTSQAVLNMMEASVASSEMTTADAKTIPGYRMAGKSGTAQKIGATGNYDGGYTGSYVAVAPVDNPQILVYVVVDEPKKGGYYGGIVAFPAASELMQQALPRYGVEPSSYVPEYTDPLTYQP